MEKPLDKFDLIATQYALSMLVGRELDLIGMWRQFLPPALKLLGCRAGYLWMQCALPDAAEAEAISFSYPRQAFADIRPRRSGMPSKCANSTRLCVRRRV